MKKFFLCFWCVIFSLASVVFPLAALENIVDTDRECTLSLTYAHEGEKFSDVEVSIFRVASTSHDTEMALTDDFAGYPVQVHNVTSQTEWNSIAETLSGYVARDGVKAYSTVKTNGDGVAVFESLETGLYLVLAITVENDNGAYVFDSFMIHLPVESEDGFDYEATAKPKGVEFIPGEEEIEYKILKLWKDEGAENKRPKSVEVDILRDGVVFDTVILNKDNSWSYSWTSPDDGSKWQVVEKNVPEGYTVNMSVREKSFVLTNTYSGGDNPPPGPDAPQTGDTFPYMLCVVVLCFSGMIITVVGVWSMRGKVNAETK